jgi:hypothetical protein
VTGTSRTAESPDRQPSIHAKELLFTFAMSGVYEAVLANYRLAATFLDVQAPRGLTPGQPPTRRLVAEGRLGAPKASSPPARRDLTLLGGHMAAPRFLFVAGTRPAQDSWFRWPDPLGLRTELVGPDGSWFGWRLAAANNRELGRSASVFADLGSCRLAVARLSSSIDSTVPATTIDDVTGLRAWQLSLDGELVAVSARRYHRQRECLYSLANFLEAVRIARVASTNPRYRLLQAEQALRVHPEDLAGTGG